MKNESINFIIAEHIKNEFDGDHPRVFVDMPIENNDRKTIQPPANYDVDYVQECKRKLEFWL